jgi:lipoprotein-anchoring transpeptidase ErfK/SrfK
MKKILTVFILAIIALSALYSYHLIKHLSDQSPINPNNLSGLYNPDTTNGIFHGQKVTASYIPPNNIAENFPNVLGTTSSDNKRIEVDLTNQKLYAYEGNRKIFDFLISSGLWGKTPTGEFRIWVKLKYTRMTGGNKAIGTFYDLPNVPYTMFFANDQVPASMGFGIHGTYWHHNFGHPMSHGCINMKTEEVEKIYNWANPDLQGKPSIRATADNPGTRVIIYGTAPNN